MATTPPKVLTPLDQIKDTKKRRRLDSLCKQYREQTEIEDAASKAKKSLMEEDIKPLMAELGITDVKGDGWNAITSKGGRTDISATKLLELGVDVDIINQAKDKKSWTYIQIVAQKDEVED